MKKILLLVIVFSLQLINEISGQSWSAVGSGISTSSNQTVRCFAKYNDKLYAAGSFMTDTVNGQNIAMWNDTSWVSVGTGLNGNVHAMAVYNGELYAAGNFTAAGNLPANCIAKWNGINWSALGSGIFGGEINSLAVYNGELYVGGTFGYVDTIMANSVAKWNGTSWSAAGAGLYWDMAAGTVNALAVFNGKLYAGGYFAGSQNVNAAMIAKWDGNNWLGVGGGLEYTVYSLTEHNGALYAGGEFGWAGGVPASCIAKWDETSWSAVGGGMDDGVYCLASHNGALYAGGYFYSAGGTMVSNIAKWNGSNWSDLAQGADNTVNSLFSDGSILYVGGWFLTTGNLSTNHVARWTDTCFSAPSQPGPIIGPGYACMGSYQTYSVNQVPGVISYTWTLPTGWTGISTSNFITTIVGTGSGIVSVIANNNCGSSLPVTFNVTVEAPLPQPGNIIGDSNVCLHANKTYSINAVPGASNYTWILPAGWVGNSVTNSINANVGSSSGLIKVTANNSCSNNPFSSMLVNADSIPMLPAVINGAANVIAGDSQTYFVNPVAGATGYNWVVSSGGGILSGQNSASVVVNWQMTGNHLLKVDAHNYCGSSGFQTKAVTVEVPTGVNILSDPFELKLMPNPSAGQFYLKAKGVQNKWIGIEIIDMSGRLVYQSELSKGNNDYSKMIDLKTFTNGQYTVKITIDKRVYQKTIIKIE